MPENPQIRKFTDNFFRFPIKVYHMEKTDTSDHEDDPVVEGDWVQGYARVSFEELDFLNWHEGFSKNVPTKQVSDQGCDLTIIYTERFGRYICLWPIKKFEEKINEFMARVASEIFSTLDEEDLII